MRELGRKNLFYSMLLAVVLLLCLLGYFVLMLPSLYVSYTEEQNLKAIKTQHQTFMDQGSYEGVPVKNPTACVTIAIPFQENRISLYSKVVSINITPTESTAICLLKEIQEWIRQMRMDDIQERQIRARIRAWQKQMERIGRDHVRMPFLAEVIRPAESNGMYQEESFRIYPVSDQMVILESSVADGNARYTNYLAVEKTKGEIVFSVLPVVTPDMEEIRPIVMQSIPMLCSVVLLLVLLFSRVYSAGIVSPVYRKLQDVNETLREENERQEVFLRASSHQLKTPVTAALLLLDGMIGRIGKYQDRDYYLPKVKEQLLSMRRIVEEILSIHWQRETGPVCAVCLYDLMETQLDSYAVAAAERKLTGALEGDRQARVCTDGDCLSKILDNLLSNAVAYTPPGGHIYVWVGRQSVRIQNKGAAIPREIMPHIFEPFVRGAQEMPSNGLGLYIAAYYAKMIHARLRIDNQEDCVEAVLEFASLQHLHSIFIGTSQQSGRIENRKSKKSQNRRGDGLDC